MTIFLGRLRKPAGGHSSGLQCSRPVSTCNFYELLGFCENEAKTASLEFSKEDARVPRDDVPKLTTTQKLQLPWLKSARSTSYPAWFCAGSVPHTPARILYTSGTPARDASPPGTPPTKQNMTDPQRSYIGRYRFGL